MPNILQYIGQSLATKNDPANAPSAADTPAAHTQKPSQTDCYLLPKHTPHLPSFFWVGSPFSQLFLLQSHPSRPAWPPPPPQSLTLSLASSNSASLTHLSTYILATHSTWLWPCPLLDIQQCQQVSFPKAL
jgi:hypothetical protein